MTQKTPQNPWQFDVRVRERNLKQGSPTEKDLEKFLTGLPDLEGQAESFGTAQPALEQPRVAPAAAPSVDYGDDEDDDEEEEDEEDEVAAAAPAPAPAPAAHEAADEAPADEPAPAADAHDPGAGES